MKAYFHWFYKGISLLVIEEKSPIDCAMLGMLPSMTTLFLCPLDILSYRKWISWCFLSHQPSPSSSNMYFGIVHSNLPFFIQWLDSHVVKVGECKQMFSTCCHWNESAHWQLRNSEHCLEWWLMSCALFIWASYKSSIPIAFWLCILLNS